MLVALGLVADAAVAGLLEAYVTPSGLPAALRVGIGAVVWLLFMAYALGIGSAAHHRATTAQDDPDLAPLPTA